MEKEIRSFNTNFNISSEGTGRTVSGYAVRFNEQSRYIGYYETISPSAITQEILDKSDIFMRYNHDMSNYLARSKYGKGTLKLELRSDGVFFEFECPDTAFGNDVLTKIKRGEVTECSFGFILSKDKDALTRSYINNETYITINKIDSLFDCSVCDNGVYTSTSVNVRSLSNENVNEKNFTILNNMEDNKDTELRSQESEKEEDKKQEEQPVEDAKDEQVEENTDEKEEKESEDEKSNDEEIEEKESEDKDKDDDKEEEVEKETKSDEETDKKEEKRSIQSDDLIKSIDKNINKNTNHNIMNTQFSLTRAINNAIKHKPQDELTQAVLNAGEKELRSCNISDYGKTDIVIPMQTRAIQVTGEDGIHDHVVETDFTSIMEPLTSKNILTDLGVTMMPGLVKDLQIPYGGAITATWEGETDAISDSSAIFNHKTMRPHRLGVVVPITIQMLEQDSIGVENFVRNEIIRAITNKVQATLFSSDAATDNMPGGVFNANNSTQGTADVASFKTLALNEALIEANDYNGDAIKYAATPKATAALRSLSYGGKSTAMVLQNNLVDGKPLFSTTAVGQNGEYVVGDWSTVYCGQWGGLVISIDDKTLLHKGIVRLIVNSYWDICYTRPEALVRANVSLS